MGMAMAAEAPGGPPDEPPYDLRARRFDPQWLAEALVVRSLSPEDLARLAGLSGETVRLAREGERLRPRSMSAILKVLADLPPVMELPER